MFTGIVQAMGCVAAITDQSAGKRLVIDCGDWRPRGGRAGDSISVSGVCLTAVNIDQAKIAFDVIGETLARTTLGNLALGDPVNLEPSVTADTPMSGHFVQGHVEGVGTVTKTQKGGQDMRVMIATPEALRKCIVPKGSVAIDGVSMTVASVEPNDFEVAMIPTTLELTTLGQVEQGTKVNIETDIVSRTVVHTVEQMAIGGQPDEGVTRRTLRQVGFVP